VSSGSIIPGATLRVEVLLDFFSESMGAESRSLTLQHVSVLGAGAMGEVHRVDIVRPGQSPLPAALKIALGDAVANREAIVREAHVLRARIQDGVAQFLALVELPAGGIGLLITFEAGRPLESLLEEGALRPNDVIALGRRLFSVLAALHADDVPLERVSTASLPQVVHGDIKPGNIIIPLDARGRPDFHQATLIDFGVARLQQRLAKVGAFNTDDVLGGTVGYMPVGHLSKGATSMSDVFAVTVVLFECLTGRSPWTVSRADAETEIARMWALEKTMAAVPPAALRWRDVRPWNHTRGWNAFFLATLAQGDPARIPTAAGALQRLDVVPRDRLFALSVATTLLLAGVSVGLWVRLIYCPEGLVRCNGACVDPERDVVNCGACGRHCGAGERCVKGACALSCPAGEERCGSSCVDTRSDRAHCGGCGARCGEGQVCASGVCKTTCGAGQQNCDGVCRDTETDRAHCGGCGVACAAGQLCARGACAATCATGFAVCEGRCFDLQSERAHCGRCDTACAGGQLCAHGRCVTSCTADLANCAGACRDLRVDRANCGACGTRCADGEGCREGRCVRECPPGLALCSTRCRDVAVDAENCGACGTRCAEGDRCVQGACAMTCGHGATACNGACRDLSRDPTSCGGCGNACGAGERCEQGRCALTCAAGTSACNGACRDLTHDATHCGGCGNACGAGERCEQGRCALTCAAGTTRCGERCAPLASDNENCGRCGLRCGDEEACRQGQCRRVRTLRPVIAPTTVVPGALRPVDSPTIPAPGSAPLLQGTPLVPLQPTPAPPAAPPEAPAG
jgi:hypothetical protein